MASITNLSRRHFLFAGSALTLGAVTTFYPKLTASKEFWLVSACSNKNHEHFVAAVDLSGQIQSKIKLPARGHDVIGLTNKLGHAIVFARRPGNFAMEVDLINNRIVKEIRSTSDSHFYGHGIISQTHNALITSENHFATGEGRIVLRDLNTHNILSLIHI